MAFADRLDRSTFARYASMGPSFDRDAFESATVEPIVLAHFDEAVAAGLVKPVVGIANRDIRLPNAWNARIAGTSYEWASVLQWQLARLVLHWAIHAHVRGGGDGVDPETAIDEAYTSLCAAMDSGDLVGPRSHPLLPPNPAFDELQDSATGDRCRMSAKGWVPTIERFNRQRTCRDDLWVVLADVEADTLHSIEIDVPTGVLVLADCLPERIHKAIQSNAEAVIGDEIWGDSHSVGNARGRVALAELTARTSNVAEICTTNTSVAPFVDGDRIVVVNDFASGDSDDDAAVEGARRAGRFCCDRWTVLAADRSTLLGLMGRRGDPEKALSKWLSEQGDEVVVLDVTPGRWRVTFGEPLREDGGAEAAGIRSNADVWFAMERIDRSA